MAKSSREFTLRRRAITLKPSKEQGKSREKLHGKIGERQEEITNGDGEIKQYNEEKKECKMLGVQREGVE